MRLFLAVLLAGLVMGQDCEPDPPIPPPPPNAYCGGAVMQPEPDALDSFMEGVAGIWNTIVGGVPSTDRRATVKVHIVGQGYCSGIAISPRTVLTAAHCYGDTLDVEIDGQRIRATGTARHPDYFRWLSRGDLEARKSDIMMVYFDQDLPGPFVSTLYNSATSAATCTGLTAQGWGRVGEGETPGLNETPYTVDSEGDKTVHTVKADHGMICFGDSGGPLYATVADTLQIAGVTSTTDSTDCLVGSTHVKAVAFKDWIEAGTQ